MLNGTDGGVHITQNNKAATVVWASLNNGYVTSQFYTASIFRDYRGDTQLMGGMQDNGTYAQFNGVPTQPWQRIFGGDGSFGAFSYNSLFVSAQQAQIRRSELVGTQYQDFSDISPSDDRDEFLFVAPLHVDRVNQDRVYVGAQGKIYYTNDVRTNPSEGEWDEIDGALIQGQFVSAIASSVQPEGILYFGTRNGRIQKISDTKDIISVSNITRSNLPQGTISSIAVDPRDGNRVFVTFGNYGVLSVWMSEDGGSSWTSISGNLEENADGTGSGPSVRSIEIMPNGTGEMVFVGTSTGLYMTNNVNGNNTNWVQQAPNIIGNVVVNMVQVRPIDGVVVAATHGNGMFKATYDISGFHPEINYSLIGETSAVLRANQSFIQGQGFGFRWFKDDVAISGQNVPELTVTETGVYKCQVTDQLGPVAFTNEVSLNFDVVLSVDDPLTTQAQVSPNPSQGVFNVNLNSTFSTGFDYSIVNSNGNQVTTGNKGFFNTEEPFKVDLSNVPDGLYILNVTNSSRTDRIKLIETKKLASIYFN